MQNGVATFIFHDSSSRGSFADQVRKLIESAQLPHETRLDTEVCVLNLGSFALMRSPDAASFSPRRYGIQRKKTESGMIRSICAR